MADSVTVTNFPDSGSRERVAFDLANVIWRFEHAGASWPKDGRKAYLDLFAECYNATYGGRDYPGR